MVFETLYNVFMRRTTVYASVVIGGALVGEQVRLRVYARGGGGWCFFGGEGRRADTGTGEA